jgi:DNA-binding NtrC family response regulator
VALKGKLLLVDDEGIILVHLSHVLARDFPNFEIVIATNGKFAAEKFDEDIRLVITDLMMPQCSGYRLIVFIRNCNLPNRNVPIIVISGVTSLGTAGTLRNVEFLSCPFSSEKLRTTLAQLLNEEKREVNQWI